MNMFDALKTETNYTYTENGARTHRSTLNPVYDLFAFSGSYRNRSDEDCIVLFKKAFAADPTLAMKCLFMCRDREEGYGERRFFRVVIHWLAKEHPEAVRRNMEYIPLYGRYDDWYALAGTSLEKEMFSLMKEQIAMDIQAYAVPNGAVSLCAKWLKSCNASSEETRKLGRKTAKAFGMTEREYRKTLSTLRKRINLLETLMSENHWNEITYETVPSKAGLQYRNAFAKHDAERYKAFIESKETNVKADVLTPVDIAHKAFEEVAGYWGCRMDDIERAALNKYWENQKDWYNGREESAIAICDVSGSMSGIPMEAAVAMSAYIAERGKGPFANHFITFSQHPQLVEFEGVDIVDKLQRATGADWGCNTNIYAVMNLLLNTAVKNNIKPTEMPERLYCFSDMEFDSAFDVSKDESKTLFENIAEQWKEYGYELPHMVFWNLNARHNLIPSMSGRVSYVSGFTMAMMESILSGKDGISLMLEKLNSDRYMVIK